MNIVVVSAFGTGSTSLSAFDHALSLTGTHNYNIISLSSIIPPQSSLIETDRYESPMNEYGHKLYGVLWDRRSTKQKEIIAAGLGWYQKEDGSGVLVEHDAAGTDEKTVKHELLEQMRLSLTDLCRIRAIPFERDRMRFRFAIGRVESASGRMAACALTLAIFQTEGWKSDDILK